MAIIWGYYKNGVLEVYDGDDMLLYEKHIESKFEAEVYCEENNIYLIEE